MITYDIVIRSTKLTSEGADTVDYVLGSWDVPDDMEFLQVMRGMAKGFHIAASMIDARVDDL